MVIFWSLSLLFLCLLLRSSFPSVMREVIHLPWFVRPGYLNVVVALSSFFLLSCPLLAYTDTATPPNTSRVDVDTDWGVDMDDTWVASPSDAARTDVDLSIDDRTSMNTDDFEDLKRDDSLRHILCGLVATRDFFGGPGLTPSSDAAFSSLEDTQGVSDLEGGPTDIISIDAPVRSARLVSVFDDYANALRYDVPILGQEYTLLLPPEYTDFLYVDSQGRLPSVLANIIQGRLVDGSSNPYAQTGKLAYLTSCLGNSFYTISEYGSPNYAREYYWSPGSLRYRDIYINIQVNQYHHISKVFDTPTYIVAVPTGGCLMCLWRKFSCRWGMFLSSSIRLVMPLASLLFYGLWISSSISLCHRQIGGDCMDLGIIMKVAEWMFHELSLLFDILWRYSYRVGTFAIGLPLLKKAVDIFR